MQSALILGGTQYFGKRLVNLLLEKGIDVTIATRGRTSDPFGNRVQRLIIDRDRRDSLEEAFDSGYWDVVFDQSCYSPKEALDVLEVLEGKVGRYIFTSTMSVYDFGEHKKEEDYDPFHYPIEIKPRSEYVGIPGYQQAKRTAEAVLFQKANIPVVALRFSLVIGEDDYTNRLQFHVDHVKQGQPMVITNPEVRLSFISSSDAANMLYWAATSNVTGPFNAASPGDLSLLEILGKIEEVTGKTALIVTDAENADRSPYSFSKSISVDTNKAIQKGFQFEDLQQLMNRLINHYATN